ncbi:MAG: DNA double-strand break repair nuclease NurA [Archaeoglobaceae archaeon]
MWKLSDEIVENLEKEIEEVYKKAEELAKKVDGWREIPSATNCVACGVDGSRGAERLSGAVLYAISAVGVGNEIREMSEITTLRPHSNIEERIRLHMHTSEFRVGCFAEEEIVLIDGSLRGAFIRPASYPEDVNKLYANYELENFVADFVEVLEEHFKDMERELATGKAKKNYLISRSEILRWMENSYRIGERRLEDFTILAEYIEYLHALNRLLDKRVFFIAKSFYTHEFDSEVCDSAILDVFALKNFGFLKSGYLVFKPSFSKSLPFFVQKNRKQFKNLFKEVNSAFVRLEDNSNIYLLETTETIDDEVISKLKGLEFDGYPLPLLQAHKIAKMKKSELRNLIASIISTLSPELAQLLRSGRDILEE